MKAVYNASTAGQLQEPVNVAFSLRMVQPALRRFKICGEARFEIGSRTRFNIVSKPAYRKLTFAV
jgi:hypothetical protein